LCSSVFSTEVSNEDVLYLFERSTLNHLHIYNFQLDSFFPTLLNNMLT
jgi:hypothetical protein